MDAIAENCSIIQSKINSAASRSGRSEADVELIAVSKTMPAERVREAVEAGLQIFGENRVQELLSKQPLLPASLRWHLIGHLQSNKVRKVLPVVEAIHSVDSLELAADINRISADLGLFPKVFLEVNVVGEASKFGFNPARLEMTLEDLFKLDRLEIQGLMCVPPISEKPGDSRPHFIALRELRDRLEKRAGTKFPSLSMGMSGDYEVAVEEGATHVRVGSALFGSRRK